MLKPKDKLNKKTSLNEVKKGRMKLAEPSAGSTAQNIGGAPLAPVPSGGQQRRGVNTSRKGVKTSMAYSNMRVPVISKDGTPLMPTIASRARRWIKIGKATGFFKKGIFCVRLNFQPSGTNKQDVCLGIDPGSKFEGFTVKTTHATFLNIQAGAVTWVKDRMETRRNMRRTRRGRNTPCRQPRFYRNRGKTHFPPSTKARWQWKLRIIQHLRKIYPITHFCVEDIAAITKPGKRRWNSTFSPLQVGKTWFYAELDKLGHLTTRQGFDTKALRDAAGLNKLNNKSAKSFHAHCVDSWVLAQSIVGGDLDNIKVLYIEPLQLYRRQLHALQPSSDGNRRDYGGTRSMGFKRGSLVRHPKYGVTYVGGTSKNRISLHDRQTGQRLAQNIKPEHCQFLTYNTWLTHHGQPNIPHSSPD